MAGMGGGPVVCRAWHGFLSIPVGMRGKKLAETLDFLEYACYNKHVKSHGKLHILHIVRERMVRLTAAGWAPAPEDRSALAIKAIRTVTSRAADRLG